MSPKPLKMSVPELCPLIFGFSVRRYQQLVVEGTVPKPEKGLVDVLEAAKAVIAYKDKLLESTGDIGLTSERTRLTRIQADRKQLDLSRAKGDLISTSEAMSLWGAILQNVKTRATAIPAKLTPLLYGREMAEIKAILERHIDEILNEWSSPDLAEISRLAADTGDSSNAKTGTKAKRLRVGRPRKSVKPGR